MKINRLEWLSINRNDENQDFEWLADSSNLLIPSFIGSASLQILKCPRLDHEYDINAQSILKFSR